MYKEKLEENEKRTMELREWEKEEKEAEEQAKREWLEMGGKP